jgi:MFS transporter, SHS family, lactate transporter
MAQCLPRLTCITCRNHGAHFENHRVAFEEGAGKDDAVIDEDARSPADSVHSDEKKDEGKV